MSTTSPNPAPAESIPKPPIDPELPAPLSMGDVMRIPMMRRLWYAQVVSVFGDFLALFAVISILTFKLHATAAFMAAYLGPASGYVLASVSSVGSACLTASVVFLNPGKAAPNPAAPAAANTSAIGKIWLDMKQGISFIVHHAALLFVILAMAAGMFVIGCFRPLIAIYVRDSLHAFTHMFGIVSPLIGLGMLLCINGLNTFC